MRIDKFASDEKMAESLEQIGIQVKSKLVALVPSEMGLPTRNDKIVEEMHLYEAYRKFCLNPMIQLDPFRDDNKNSEIC